MSILAKRRTLIPGLLRDDRGISSVEFALVCAVFFMCVLGILDFSRALWEWNKAAKATQAGVRYAVVSDLVALNLQNLDGTSLAPIGTSVPLGAVSPNPTYCTIAGCGSSIASPNAAIIDLTAFQDIVAEMQKYYAEITDQNVVVEYYHAGLGFAGNPAGPDVDPVVTVWLRDMEFTFLTPGLASLPTLISLPPFRASLTSEDGKG
jgi:hypothetical protein